MVAFYGNPCRAPKWSADNDSHSSNRPARAPDESKDLGLISPLSTTASAPSKLAASRLAADIAGRPIDRSQWRRADRG